LALAGHSGECVTSQAFLVRQIVLLRSDNFYSTENGAERALTLGIMMSVDLEGVHIPLASRLVGCANVQYPLLANSIRS